VMTDRRVRDRLAGSTADIRSSSAASVDLGYGLLDMRILVWNMGPGGPGGSAAGHERAWRYLLEEKQFDVPLLQETRAAPGWASDRLRSVTWRPRYATAGRNRPLWGCAIISTSLDLRAYDRPAEFRWLRERSGSVAIAQTTGDPRWFASVHFYAGEIPDEQVQRHSVEGIPISTPNGTVWETDVLPHELDRVFGRDTFLWGGDFNADPRMDDVRGLSAGTAGASPPTRRRARGTRGPGSTIRTSKRSSKLVEARISSTTSSPTPGPKHG
jgi:endonuclease/exonuclease/phosphatase family metal-dependent hydrolase